MLQFMWQRDVCVSQLKLHSSNTMRSVLWGMPILCKDVQRLRSLERQTFMGQIQNVCLHSKKEN